MPVPEAGEGTPIPAEPIEEDEGLVDEPEPIVEDDEVEEEDTDG
jgi:hypothetical protein